MVTTQQALLPPIPQPPHDPSSWLLNSVVGWRAAVLQNVQQGLAPNSLTLALVPESRRALVEGNGSFGGLTTPANIAFGPDDSIYLLDSTTAQLKRFDPCDCEFQPVPCFGGVGSGPRQLKNPHGIAICSGNLFVCDTANHRVAVFSLHGFVLRGFWQPPPSAYQGPNPALTNNWTPFDLAFDRHGRLYVTDPANASIHLFSAAGIWQKTISNPGQVSWISIDCRNRIYAVVEGLPATVVEVKDDGSAVQVTTHAEELVSFFPQLPFWIDAQGLLHLERLCKPPAECDDFGSSLKCPPHQAPERGLFDQNGNLIKRCAKPTSVSYLNSGLYISEALDSELYRCQWHRVILHGEIPAGSGVIVSTYTAEALLTNNQVQALGPEWETNLTADKTIAEWDGLIRSGGGRFLWLKLEFFGNSKVTPRIDSIEIEFPRISLRRYLPAVFGEETTSADFTDRFLSIFDTTLRSIESTLDRQAHFYDPLSTPSKRDPRTGIDFLSWLGSWIGISLDRNWPEAKRRQFLKQAGKLFDLRGTREGLWRELLLFLDLEENNCCCGPQPSKRCRPDPLNCAPEPTDCRWDPPPLILEYFKLRRWLFLGAGRIGDQAVLWGKRIINRSQLNTNAQVGETKLVKALDPYRDPFHYYAHRFAVFVPACYRNSEAHRKALENLLRASRPAATLAHIEYVEPRFRIGFQSMIGFDSVIGRYPAGVTLDQTTLGRASVLTSPPHKQGGPSLEIGDQSRIGSTTILE